MTPQSGKAKGRKLQQFVAACLHDIDPTHVYYSRSMGDSGSDVYGGPLVKGVYVECRSLKAYQSLNAVVAEMRKGGTKWWYVAKVNKQPPIVVLPWDVFEALVRGKSITPTETTILHFLP